MTALKEAFSANQLLYHWNVPETHLDMNITDGDDAALLAGLAFIFLASPAQHKVMLISTNVYIYIGTQNHRHTCVFIYNPVSITDSVCIVVFAAHVQDM